MWTLCLVRNAISIDLNTIRTPEMQPSHYFINWTLSTAPTSSPPIQTHPCSGYFTNKFVGYMLFVNEHQEELKARNNTRTTRYHLSALLVTSMCFTFEVIGHTASLEIAVSHTHVVSITPERGHLDNLATSTGP